MPGDNLFRASDRDPVAELAPTSGQADPHNENAPTNNRPDEDGASHDYDQSPPLAPADYPSAPEQACECDEHRHDDVLSEHPYDQRDHAYDVNYDTEKYAIQPQLIRLVLVIAIVGLAVAGTGIAFGYRAMFGSSTSP